MFTSLLRFRVELFVDDGKDSATFTVFNNEMTKLTKKIDVLSLDVVIFLNNTLFSMHFNMQCNCYCKHVKYQHTAESKWWWGWATKLTWRASWQRVCVQIRVTPYNFTPNHRTFIVSTISGDLNFGTHEEVRLFQLPHVCSLGFNLLSLILCGFLKIM